MRYRYCEEYYKKGIYHNVDIFLKRLRRRDMGAVQEENDSVEAENRMRKQ